MRISASARASKTAKYEVEGDRTGGDDGTAGEKDDDESPLKLVIHIDEGSTRQRLLRFAVVSSRA